MSRLLKDRWVCCFTAVSLCVLQVHYLFGGNPGKDSQPKMRLDDLWSLKVFVVCSVYYVHLFLRLYF